MESYLTVIIPTLNNIKGLIYLKKYFNNKSYVIRIIDNSKTNLGFAGGVNSAGLKDEVNTKWLLILNDDIEFNDKISNNKSQITNESQIINNKYQNTIEKLIFFAEENKLEAVTPVLRNPDGGIENLGFRVLPYGKIELINKYDKYSNNQIFSRGSLYRRPLQNSHAYILAQLKSAKPFSWIQESYGQDKKDTMLFFPLSLAAVLAFLILIL